MPKNREVNTKLENSGRNISSRIIFEPELTNTTITKTKAELSINDLIDPVPTLNTEEFPDVTEVKEVTEEITHPIKKKESETEDETAKEANSAAESSIDFKTIQLPIIESPKTLKTVEIENNSSLEISADKDIINIDLVKMDTNDESILKIPYNSPEISKKCALKFDENDKEMLNSRNVNLDIEEFKNHYLTEVSNLQCDLKPKLIHNSISGSELKNKSDTSKIVNKNKENESEKTEANLKRKLKINIEAEDKKIKKRRLMRKSENRKLHKKLKDLNATKEAKKRLNLKDYKTQLSIGHKRFDMKINLRLNLNIDCERKKKATKKKKISNKRKLLMQTVLNLSPECSSTDVLVKPLSPVTPVKRNIMKKQIISDKLKQMSISSFLIKNN